jgi:hypothetical protein
MNKKADATVLNIIIAAVILLVAAIIILAIFSGKVNLFARNVDSCYSKGGQCSTDGSCPDGTVTLYTKDCRFYPESEAKDKLGQCCVKL